MRMILDRLRFLLIPLSPLYAFGVALRNMFFELGFFEQDSVEKPVISVGNISAGGVGKTPLVELIVNGLRARTTVGIVSRGYARKSHGTVVAQDGHRSLAGVVEVGDELRQLADRFPDTIVVADERRVRGARMAIALGAQVVVLDDGFQHRYLRRDADIVVMTASEILKGEFVFPAGNRREPLSGVRRATLIAVTRCGDDLEMDRITAKLARFGKPLVFLRTQMRDIHEAATHRSVGMEALAGRRIVAFSGIGTPTSFERILNESGAHIVRHFQYRDHHWYRPEDLRAIELAHVELRSHAIVTTEKDAARLQEGTGTGFIGHLPVYAVGIEQVVVRGQKALDRVLDGTGQG